MLFRIDLGCDHHPGAGFQRLGLCITARHAAELDVIHAAGHHKPTRGEHGVPIPSEHGNLGLEADGLTLIFLRFFCYIPVPQGVILIIHLNDRCVDVKGQRVFHFIKGCGAIGIVIQNVNATAGGTGQFVEGHGVLTGSQAIKDHHLCPHQLVHHQVTHVGVIGHKGGGISEHDLLCNHPILRETGIEVSHHLHAVQLRNHTLSLVFFRQVFQFLGSNRLLIQSILKHILMGIGGKIVLLLPFLKHQQKCSLPCIETGIFQGLLDKFRLTGIQKAGKGINRDLLHITLQTARQRRLHPNSNRLRRACR